MRNCKTADPEKYIILYPKERHETEIAPLGKSYQLLRIVSKYAVSLETIHLRRGYSMEKLRDAYLGGNWLYYCRNTPVWKDRICELCGKIDDEKKTVVFPTDEMLETFYERWGLEPDEQCAEMHRWHGVDFE
jgi:hypothetical protein